VRTVIAPYSPEVETEPAALDTRPQTIARRYVRRLALQPYLGGSLHRGLLAEHECRRIYFDRDDDPDDLFGAGRPGKRQGNEDLCEGPAWRIVYWIVEAKRCEIRLVVILAVAPGHARPGYANAYELAAKRLETLIDAMRKRGEAK